MNRNEGVERPRGGKDKQDLTQQERIEIKNDNEYDDVVIDENYVKKLKSQSGEIVYVE